MSRRDATWGGVEVGRRSLRLARNERGKVAEPFFGRRR